MTGMILLYIFGTFSAIFAFAGICWEARRVGKAKAVSYTHLTLPTSDLV